VEVHAVGKVSDLFAGIGITRSHAGADNASALASVEAALAQTERGLVFANLIETDQTFGHRKDVEGFHGALRALDGYLAGALERLRDDDVLIVTADHGVDPAQRGSDHTREYAPLLAATGAMWRAHARGGGRGGARHDGALADVGATVLRWLTGVDARDLPGTPFTDALGA
jgi:phosphopentomutase